MPNRDQLAAASRAGVTSRRVMAARVRIADLATLDPPPTEEQRRAVLSDAMRLYGVGGTLTPDTWLTVSAALGREALAEGAA